MQAETKGHDASPGTSLKLLQTFQAQPKPAAAPHGCFRSKSARVHFFPSKQPGADNSQELPSKVQPTKVKLSHVPSFSFIYNGSLLPSRQTSRSPSAGCPQGSAPLNTALHLFLTHEGLRSSPISTTKPWQGCTSLLCDSTGAAPQFGRTLMPWEFT